MQTSTTFIAAVIIAVGALLSSSENASGQNPVAGEPLSELSASRGTPSVLPRPDFHFSGNVGRTIIDSDKPQFPQPVQCRRWCETSC